MTSDLPTVAATGGPAHRRAAEAVALPVGRASLVRRTAAVAAVAIALAVTVAVAPAANAMETSQFGIAPGPGAEVLPGGERVRVDGPRGGTAHTEVRVWNRLDRPLTLRLETVAATVDDGGTASLGGDAAAAGWASLDRSVVALGPEAEQTVRVTVQVPRRTGEGRRTLAVLVQPETEAGEAPSVIERLALVVAIDPAAPGGDFAAWAWAAGLLTLLVLVATVWAARRRNRPVRPAVSGPRTP